MPPEHAEQGLVEPAQADPLQSEPTVSELVATESEGDGIAAAAPPPRHRVERSNWDEPVAEEAPVWTPTDVDDATLVDPADQSALGEATQTAEFVAEPSAHQEADTTVGEADTGQLADTEQPIAAQALEPQWNEEWNAWMFWDEGQQSWLRHDTDNDVWVRVEP